jgi:uncharacterized protein (DUF111 family)
MPEFALDRIGYGVGTKSWDDAPNVVRAVLGRAVSKHTNEAGLLVEANLDDATGQWVARAIEVLTEAGAAEAWATPVTGRKGRPGFVLSALCSPARLEAVRQVFIRETPTLGVRITSHERRPLDRDWVTVSTPWGEVRVKRGIDAGRVVNLAPEYDDCLAAAKAHAVPVKEVWQAAMAVARGV